nr:MAG: nicotinamide-nucleotide amidase [Pseudomonadota bacterium]
MNREVPSDKELELRAIRAGEALLARGEVVALAESCTGGYVAKLLTDVPGSSRWFGYGLVTYSNEAKQRLLGVSATTLEKEGAVSERTALEMAVGALALSGATRAIGITGIAGPDGGSEAKPVGLVWFARAVRLGEGTVGAIALPRKFSGNRDEVRRQAAAYALDLLTDP